MRALILVDTGPLVAGLLKRDQHHDWATKQFQDFDSPLITCEAVLTEIFHLIRPNQNAHRQVSQWLNQGFIQTDFSFANQREPVLKAMEKYADLPMSFADACLVRMAQLHLGARVFTLDQHFRVYRMGRRRVPLIIPPAK